MDFDFTGAQILVELFTNVEVFMLVLVRIFGFLVIMPPFSGQSIPITVRVLFAFVSALVVASTGVITPPAAEAPFELFIVILNEFLAGFLIGFVGSILFSIFHMVGQQTDFKIGFMMMSIHDPITQIQIPVTGNLFYFVFLVFFVSQGGLSLAIYFMLGTYQSIPPGNAFILGNYGLGETFVNLIGTYLELGLLFAMPVIAVTTIIDAALGILVKAVPQMNVFVVGMPIKTGVGLLTIYLLVPFWYNLIYTRFHDVLFENVLSVIRGLGSG